MGLKEIRGEVLSAASLFGPNDGLNPMRSLYRNNLVNKQEPFETGDSPEALLKILSRLLNNSTASTSPEPYWLTNQKINCHSLNAALIQFANEHTGYIHNSVTPPSVDVGSYINSVLNSENRIGITDQYTSALAISKQNILGALLINVWGSRITARNRDTRVYPDICITADTMQRWRDQIIALPCFQNQTSIDVTGDNYYFWTHCTAAYVNDFLGNRITDAVFDNGTKMMVKVRALAGKPTMSEHHEATLFGRAIGKSMAYLAKHPDTIFSED